MRDYGKLYSGFWTSADMQSMSDDGKMLAAYLLTCHHSTIIGCFRLPDGYVADDLGWCAERVAKGFVELLSKGFATRNEQSKWVVIHKYIKWNQPENPNQVKAAVKAFNQVPDECGVKAVLARSLSDFCVGFNAEILEPFLNPSETLSKPVTVTVTVTGAKTEGEQVDSGSPKKTKRKKLEEKTLQEFLNECESSGEQAIPSEDPVFEFTKSIKLPDRYLEIGWESFKLDQAADKRQKDWRATFRNYVRNGYLGVWAINRDGEFYLTTKGKQLDMASLVAA